MILTAFPCYLSNILTFKPVGFSMELPNLVLRIIIADSPTILFCPNACSLNKFFNKTLLTDCLENLYTKKHKMNI